MGFKMSLPTYDLILKNGTCVLPEGIVETDIAVCGDTIVDFGSFKPEQAGQVIDCTGLHILPGVIDTQVHFREPGMEHKETLETGMMAAAMGGVTAIFEMPNTKPLTTSPEALEDKLNRASKAAWTDYAFYFGGTAQNAKNLREWENLKGVCGVKIFMGSSTGDLLVATDEEVEAVLSNGKRVVAVHAEDEMMMKENKIKILGDSTDVCMHPKWRSEEGCLSATTRLVRIARKYGRKIHVLHISTQQEMEYLKNHKDIASVEVLANHLTLYAPDCYETLGTRAQQNPPIREKHHQDALWRGIADGTVDILGSDHAPHTLEEKAKTYPESPSGTPGVQTLVPVMLDHIHHGRLTLERFVDMTASGPHRIHQIARKGRIVQGYDADFTIVDLKKVKTITNAQQKSKSGWTGFDGKTVTGWPIMTIIRGHIVMREDELLGPPIGEAVRFREIL
jgi:dihydroorotase